MSSLTLKQFVSPLLAPFDLHVAAGECVSLHGPSGSGKTRLLRAIANLDPHQGEALLDATPAAEMSPPEWRKRVGLLTAESFWWEESLARHFQSLNDENFTQLNFKDDISGWEITRLSSGEKQRLALIRLLQNQPAFLLLDEPTANLDQENTQRVETLLESWRVSRQCGMLWISHDPAQRERVAQRHLQIDSGQLRELK